MKYLVSMKPIPISQRNHMRPVAEAHLDYACVIVVQPQRAGFQAWALAQVQVLRAVGVAPKSSSIRRAQVLSIMYPFRLQYASSPTRFDGQHLNIRQYIPSEGALVSGRSRRCSLSCGRGLYTT